MSIALGVERPKGSRVRFQLSRLGDELGFPTEYGKVRKRMEILGAGIAQPDQAVELVEMFPRGIYFGEKMQRLVLKLRASNKIEKTRMGLMYSRLSDGMTQGSFEALQRANDYVRVMIFEAND